MKAEDEWKRTFIGGIAARALRLSPVVGYLVAGIILGPFTPGFTADQKITHKLAEIGRHGFA